jgi:hypothetical protein
MTNLQVSRPISKRKEYRLLKRASKYAKKYLADFSLDPKHLGKLLSGGKQHYIYQYQLTSAIKIPQSTLYMKAYGVFTYDDIVRDVAMLEEFLPEFMVPNQVYSTKRHTGYVVIQPLLNNPQAITPENFPHVKDDFLRLIEMNKQMIAKYQCSVDFFGNKGFQSTIWATLLRQPKRAFMANLLLVEEEGKFKIKIVDINLSRLKYNPKAHMTFIGWLLDKFTYEAARFMIRANYGVAF